MCDRYALLVKRHPHYCHFTGNVVEGDMNLQSMLRCVYIPSMVDQCCSKLVYASRGYRNMDRVAKAFSTRIIRSGARMIRESEICAEGSVSLLQVLRCEAQLRFVHSMR